MEEKHICQPTKPINVSKKTAPPANKRVPPPGRLTGAPKYSVFLESERGLGGERKLLFPKKEVSALPQLSPFNVLNKKNGNVLRRFRFFEGENYSHSIVPGGLAVMS
jgi:hypothetical protein